MSPVQGCIDVLIIGAGPAGLMCATALAKAGVTVRIIDKRRDRITAGHADGLMPRTCEVLQSYGLVDRLVQEGNHVYLFAFYDPGRDGGIKLTERFPLVTDQSTQFPFGIGLSQARLEAVFIDSLRDHGIEVERPSQPSALEIVEDIDELSILSSYPVKVTIEHLDEKNDEMRTEIIRAKYVVGADGAHSWVRRSLGIPMEGEQTDVTYGVVDVIAESNFPDIRNVTTIHSPSGSCLIIAREGDRNRLYVQLSDMGSDSPSEFSKDGINPQKLLAVARKRLYPYELGEPKLIEWWSTYAIGQRLASSYSVKDRIFIAGDACHTHSPKAGQGMNASINDTHNLAWKLVQVLRGWSNPSLLKTYEHERRTFAQQLIDFDKEWAALFSRKPKTAENEDGVSPEEYFKTIQTNLSFVTGFGIHYSPSTIVDVKHQKCAVNLVIGERMLPQMFIQAADVRPIEIQHLLRSDIRFKLLFFVGEPSSARAAELDLLAEELGNPSGLLRKYSPDGNISTIFGVITIIAGNKNEVNHLSVPAFFRPHWSSVLLDDVDTRNIHGGRAYERFGIDPKKITLVVVRPDGYIGTIVPSPAIEDLERYFCSFMVPQVVGC